MIRINEIALSLDEDESQLKKKAAKILKINEKYIKKYTIYKYTTASSIFCLRRL